MNIKQFLGEHVKTKQDLTEEDILTIHDRLMVEYGWIPLQEFKSLPVPTLFGLLEEIRKRKEAEEKEYKKHRR